MDTIPDLVGAEWRKSSYSDGGADNCVEVFDGFPASSRSVTVRTPPAVCCSSQPLPGRAS